MDINKEPTSCLPSERNIALISEVKKFSSLYDTSDPKYYILAERNRAWLQVAENCGQPVDQCHLRWKSLRKRYAKERRKLPDILQGLQKPWPLYPKMSFLAPSNAEFRYKAQLQAKKKSESFAEDFNKINSDDDMLIVGENNEIVRTCKSGDISEEDEYIYETLDDPDSALEIMKNKSYPKMKHTAIRSGKVVRPPPAVPSRIGGSGRIRKLTPKMQNSLLAKKLKHAQQIMQQMSSTVNTKPQNPSKSNHVKSNKNVHHRPNQKLTTNKVSYNANQIKTESGTQQSLLKSNKVVDNKEQASSPTRPFKVVKLQGKNPMIFSPEQLPEIQSFLKSESSANIAQSNAVEKSPLIKVKSVDHLNNMSTSSSSSISGEHNNFDIIHSVGLMRKSSTERTSKAEKTSHQTYSRAYSWNRPEAKAARQEVVERPQPQPDSQTNDFEIEEAWNDIKQETIDDVYWNQSQEEESGYLPHEPMVMMETPVGTSSRVEDAKLDLVLHQRKLLEEQHKRTMEYMKKEHELKMILLKAEIELKRKQLNIML